MDNAHMKRLLSTITEFDDLKGKRFTAKKCKDICPKIASIQRSLGFSPGEPINAKNIHRIIPAAKDISAILNKRKKSTTPMQKIPAGQVLTPQNRFLPGSSRMSGAVHIPNRTNGVNCRFSTPTSTKSSIKKVSAHHDIVGAILKQSSSTAVFSSPITTKSSMAKVTAPRNLHGRILEHDSSQTTNGRSRPTANRTSIGITNHLPAPNIKDSSPVKVSISQNRFRPGSSNISGVTSRVHTPNTTNGVNHRFSTKSSVQKISAGHDVVGAILKRASFTALPSRFSTPNTAKSSIKKDKVRSSKNPDVEPTSSQESGISASTDDSEISEEKENEITDLIF